MAINGNGNSGEFMTNVSVVGLNEKLAGLILSVRDLSARIEASGMTGVQVKEALQKCFRLPIYSPQKFVLCLQYTQILRTG